MNYPTYPSPQPQAFPPPPPPRRRHTGRWVALAAVVVLGLGGAAAAGLVLTTEDSAADGDAPASPFAADDSIRVEYTVEVVTDDYCANFGDTGYGDLPGGEVELFDGSGHLLGFGTLDSGDDTSTSCIFSVSFDAERSEDGLYRITSGNTNRGFINYNESELVNDTLYADAVLGS